MGKTIASILTNETKQNKFLLFHTAEHWQIKQTIQNILCETFDNLRPNSEIIKAYLTILFSRLIETENYEMFLRKVVKSTNISIVNLLAYIDANYLNMTLEDTAKLFGYSPEHLGRIIKKVTGKTFSAVIHEQKFKHAAKLLRMTDRTIESISEEIGYSNLTYFYRKFHDLYGLTPRDYRRQFEID
ncbi:Transposon Tn10 TetD protein [compost metagenome]